MLPTPRLALVLLATAVLACNVGGPSTEAVEDRLRGEFLSLFGQPLDSVDCPDDVEPAAGVAFACTAVAGGQTFFFDVTMNSESNFDYGSRRLIRVDGVEQTVANGFQQQNGVAITVDCGEAPFLVHGAGDQFTCSATAPDGGTAVVYIGVTDETGTVNWRINDDGR